MVVNLRNKIYPILAQKGLSVEDFAGLCEMSGNGMHGIFKNNDTKVSTLIKMAKVLDIDVREFFEPDSEDGSMVNEPPTHYGSSAHTSYLLDKLMEAEQEIKRLKNNES